MQLLLRAENLQKTFVLRGQEVRALRGVSLSIAEGEVLAFLGPNGAGKTTTIKILMGLVVPDSGSVWIQGLDPVQDARALAGIGTVLEGNRNLYWRLTALENLVYFAALKGISARDARLRGRELLQRFGLSHAERSPVQVLSRGMQQRLALAVALLHRPKLLLLDEPTLGLDVEAAHDVKQLIRDITAEGCGVLLTTHQLDVAEELAQRIAIIRDGVVLIDEPCAQVIRRLGGESYSIVIEGKVEAQKLLAVEAAGGFVVDRGVVCGGDPARLYAVLSALQPLPIVKVEKQEARLTDVFLKLIKQSSPEEKELSC